MTKLQTLPKILCAACIHCLTRKHVTGKAAAVLPEPARDSRGVRLIFIFLIIFSIGFTSYQVTKLTLKYLKFDAKTTVSLIKQSDNTTMVLMSPLFDDCQRDLFGVYDIGREMLIDKLDELLVDKVRLILSNFTNDDISDLFTTTALIEVLLSSDWNTYEDPNATAYTAQGLKKLHSLGCENAGLDPGQMPSKLEHLLSPDYRLSCYFTAYNLCSRAGVSLSQAAPVVSRYLVDGIFGPIRPELETYSVVTGPGGLVGVRIDHAYTKSDIVLHFALRGPVNGHCNLPVKRFVAANPGVDSPALTIEANALEGLFTINTHLYRLSERYCNPNLLNMPYACEIACVDKTAERLSAVCKFPSRAGGFSVFYDSSYRACTVGEIINPQLRVVNFLGSPDVGNFEFLSNNDETHRTEYSRITAACLERCDSDESFSQPCHFSSSEITTEVLEKEGKINSNNQTSKVISTITFRSALSPVLFHYMEEDYSLTHFLADLSGQLGFAVSVLSGLKIATVLWSKIKGVRTKLRAIEVRWNKKAAGQTGPSTIARSNSVL